MKLETGKYYRTREGMRVFCANACVPEVKDAYIALVVDEKQVGYWYTGDGRFIEVGDTRYDIIGEWENTFDFRVGGIYKDREGDLWYCCWPQHPLEDSSEFPVMMALIKRCESGVNVNTCEETRKSGTRMSHFNSHGEPCDGNPSSKIVEALNVPKYE